MLDEPVKVIGPLRISIPLFNIFLNEADELSRRLVTELAEWGLESMRHPVPESSVALAHSLAGTSATVGYGELSALARSLEHALARSHATGRGRRGEPPLFNDAADEIRRLLHQFAAGFLPPASAQLMERLAEHEHWPEPSAVGAVPGVAVEISDFLPLMAEPEPGAAVRSDAFDDDEDIDATDAVDAELFPVFDEEAAELLPQLQTRLREWHEHPGDRDAPAACMRALHTLKGGARLAGAMRLGEMAHRLETAIEHLGGHGAVHPTRSSRCCAPTAWPPCSKRCAPRRSASRCARRRTKPRRRGWRRCRPLLASAPVTSARPSCRQGPAAPPGRAAATARRAIGAAARGGRCPAAAGARGGPGAGARGALAAAGKPAAPPAAEPALASAARALPAQQRCPSTGSASAPAAPRWPNAPSARPPVPPPRCVCAPACSTASSAMPAK
ncbi:MAG: Hpt domain-containing protein [Rubrivivax sp.]